ncbi:AMP-binding protein, partial [Listeria monocytogenes]|nr:AMP-binding protein [Listeria monocytogenes]
SIPYGFPLRNQQMYVLNYDGSFSPVGVQGEICIGGIGVSKGYVNNEEQTNTAFVNHPILGRIYHTGDYGIATDKGYIEFMGRKDHQIKIRGYRVELGEIESKMLSHEFIDGAVVIDYSGENNQKKLCSYYVSEEDISDDEIKRYLERELPAYMVPSYFIELDEVPLTQNGKINRKVLPLPDISSPQEIIVPPRNELDEKLLTIWQHLLEVEEISITNNFFELGGDSIMLVKLRTEMLKIGIEISLSNLLNNLTIEKTGNFIGEKHEENRFLSVAKNINAQKNIFCFPPIVSMGIVYQQFSEKLKDFNVYAFDFVETSDIYQFYFDTILDIQPDGEYIFVGISAGGNLAFELAKYFESKQKKVQKIILLDSYFIDQKNDVSNSTEQNYTLAKETVDQLYNLYPELESIKDYVEKEVVKNIVSYYSYLEGLVNGGRINSEILILQSELVNNKYLRGDIHKWLTVSKSSELLRGFGPHEKMLDNEYLDKNIKLMNEFLQR